MLLDQQFLGSFAARAVAGDFPPCVSRFWTKLYNDTKITRIAT
jgi:hypothetical protein